MQAENVRLRSENEALKRAKGKKVEADQEIPIAPGVRATTMSIVGSSGEPEWMVEWRKSKHFSEDSAAILLLGKTGISRRPEIERELGKVIEVEGNSGT